MDLIIISVPEGDLSSWPILPVVRVDDCVGEVRPLVTGPDVCKVDERVDCQSHSQRTALPHAARHLVSGHLHCAQVLQHRPALLQATNEKTLCTSRVCICTYSSLLQILFLTIESTKITTEKILGNIILYSFFVG